MSPRQTTPIGGLRGRGQLDGWHSPAATSTARWRCSGRTTPGRNVGYLAQQAAEKALKAAILLGNAPFEMTHDLNAVAAQLPADFPAPVDTADLAWLADLETAARYPDEGDTVTGDDARQAVGLAGTILAAVAEHFTARGVDEAQIAPE